ncbi:MFS transporter [Nocardioides daejeonensis]|uniref:MFS transporter n=1 Tax=Nocardioides daejeonensis TaxID=1046556 RepID=UPI000D74B6CA|nr:MFS transporter [Nocardioides daejeonensis]
MDRGSFAPLRERNFRWYFSARVVNTLGTTMASVALAFAVLHISDSPAALGTVLAAHSIPMVVFLLLGGVVADRFDRARLLRLCNLMAGLSQLASAVLVISGQAELWHLVVLGAANGTVSSVSQPAMAGVVPQLVPREHLQAANVLLSMIRGGLTVLGPSTAAAIVVTLGPGWALAVDAATWLVSAVLLLGVRIPPRTGKHGDSVLRELREGWGLFVGHAWLWIVVSAFSILNAIHSGAWFTLGPVLAKETIGERGWGLVLSAEAIGLLVTTVVMLRVRLRRPLLWGMLGCATFGVPILVLGADLGLAATIVAAVVAGMGIEVFGLGWNLAMQENIEEEKLSRAYSYDMLGSFVAIPVGQLLFGPLGAAFGLRTVMVTAGCCYVALALLTLAARPVRQLERA